MLFARDKSAIEFEHGGKTWVAILKGNRVNVWNVNNPLNIIGVAAAQSWFIDNQDKFNLEGYK